MRLIFCLKGISRAKTSFVLLSILILIALISSIMRGIFLIHANEIASLQNIDHYYEKRLEELVQSEQDP